MLSIGQEIKPVSAIPTGEAPGKETASYGTVSASAPAKVIGVQTVNGQTYYNLDQSAIGGGTGWAKGSDLEAAVAGTAAPGASAGATPAGGGQTTYAPTEPTINLSAVYDQAYNTTDIKNAQADYDKAQSDMNARLAAKNTAESIINDNPYYSEATRVGKVNQLNQQYNNDITVMQNAATQAQNKITSLKADAAIQVNLKLQQYNIDDAIYKNKLSEFNSLLSAGGLVNASGSDIASYAVALGIPTSSIQSIIDKQKSDAVKAQVITSTDDSGNMWAVTLNADTGAVINKTSLGRIAKGTSATEASQSQALNQNVLAVMVAKAGLDGKVAPDIYQIEKEYYTTHGGTPANFDATFGNFVNASHYQDYGVSKTVVNPDAFKTTPLQSAFGPLTP
jgi:hypothetical protein